MGISFEECEVVFAHNQTYIDLYSYTGDVYKRSPGAEYITLEGCNILCGPEPKFFEWDKIAFTITTWILPIFGLILGAPFEPNDFKQNMVALLRWMGSPIMSLSAVLWNIRFTGKCCLILDLSTKYSEVPPLGSDFADLRHAMSILGMMNQFMVSHQLKTTDGSMAEDLLRVALFANLEVPHPIIPGSTITTVELRERLSRSVQIRRRRGVVPNLLTYLWFVFALVISIEASFGKVGESPIANDLALGLVLSWIPILMLCSIIDRNPVSVWDICAKFNKYMHVVRTAMLDPENRKKMSDITGRSPDSYIWTSSETGEAMLTHDMFAEFAGQARTRWHYGVGYSIIAGIEEYVAKYGREWLSQPTARRALLGKSRAKGVFWFDPFSIWEILLAMMFILGTAAGAFWISFWTPTVGLSCHSGGYLVFVILSFSLFFAEMTAWHLLPRNSSGRRRVHIMLLVGEVTNMLWLCYITIAQTFGIYQTCSCASASWSSLGGYVNLANSTVKYREPNVINYWIGGTVFSCIVLAWGSVWVVVKWCEQSHIVTSNYDSAARGLMRTRKFMNATKQLRWGPRHVVWLFLLVWSRITGKKRTLRMLTWTKHAHAVQDGRKISAVTTGSDTPSDEKNIMVKERESV